MADTTYARRAMQQMQDPRALDAYAQSVLGVSPRVAQQMLSIHAALIDGKKVSPAMQRQIQEAWPHIAEVPTIVAGLNSVDPGSRPARFLALLSGDVPAISGNYSEAGEMYRALDNFSSSYHAEAAAARISQRQDANTDPAIARRRIERDVGDGALGIRAQIEAQLGGDDMKHARNITEAAAAGDPTAETLMRDHMATRAEIALDKLQAEDTTTREALDAAWEVSATRDIAEDLGYVDKEPT